jgi:TPR repeat protein
MRSAWYRLASEHAHPAAIRELAHLLEENHNLAEALLFYKRAAEELADVDAMNNAGMIYRKCGDLSDAMNNLGELYSEEGNLDEAKVWLQKAAEKGSARAERSLRRLNGNL